MFLTKEFSIILLNNVFDVVSYREVSSGQCQNPLMLFSHCAIKLFIIFMWLSGWDLRPVIFYIMWLSGGIWYVFHTIRVFLNSNFFVILCTYSSFDNGLACSKSPTAAFVSMKCRVFLGISESFLFDAILSSTQVMLLLS